MVEYKLQHYLPRFLSKRFAFKGESVLAYNILDRSVSPRSFKIGAEKYFYTRNHASEFETIFARRFEDFIEKIIINFDNEMVLPKREGFEISKISKAENKQQEILDQYPKIESSTYFQMLQYLVFQDQRSPKFKLSIFDGIRDIHINQLKQKFQHYRTASGKIIH